MIIESVTQPYQFASEHQPQENSVQFAADSSCGGLILSPKSKALPEKGYKPNHTGFISVSSLKSATSGYINQIIRYRGFSPL